MTFSLIFTYSLNPPGEATKPSPPAYSFPYIPRPNRLIIWPAAVTPLITGLSLSRPCAEGRSLNSSQLGLEGGKGAGITIWERSGVEGARASESGEEGGPNIDICPYVAAAAATVGFLDRPGKGEKSKEDDYILLSLSPILLGAALALAKKLLQGAAFSCQIQMKKIEIY